MSAVVRSTDSKSSSAHGTAIVPRLSVMRTSSSLEVRKDFHAVLYRELALCTPKEKFAGPASPNVAESGPDVSLANGLELGDDQFDRICK